MSRASRLILLAAVGLVFIGTAAAGHHQLVVTAEDGTTLWALPVSPGERVVLSYINSLYLAPTEEHFVIKDGGFALREVQSTSDAVLAYNMLPTPYNRQGQFLASSVSAFVPTIVTRIGPIGQQSLTVGDRTLPLFAAGTGARVSITLRRASLPALFLAWLRR